MKKYLCLPLAAAAVSLACFGCASAQISPNAAAMSVADSSAQQEALSAIAKIEAAMKRRHRIAVTKIEHVSGPTRQERQIAPKPFEKTVEHWYMTCDGVPQRYEVTFWPMTNGQMTYSVRLP